MKEFDFVIEIQGFDRSSRSANNVGIIILELSFFRSLSREIKKGSCPWVGSLPLSTTT